jgi:formate dehydrogenase iron-sulfur subunit
MAKQQKTDRYQNEHPREDTSKNRSEVPEKNCIISMNRRRFLGTMGAMGTTLLAGSASQVSAYNNFEGWPDRYGMLTDLTACVGCRSCEKACNEVNGLPKPEKPFDDATVFEKERRPDTGAFTVVNRYENPKDAGRPVYRKIQCMHCNEPACATACPIHAYTKTPEGAVLYDPDKCFGCRYCMIACPFYAPAYDYESAFEPRILKCILCYDRLKEGKMPACAQVCPMEAITFGKREDLIQLARKKIMGESQKYINHIYGEKEVGGTTWLYISEVPFEQLGFPTDLPQQPLIEQTKGFLSSVPVVFTVWPALFGMIYSSLSHRENLKKEIREDQDRREVEK